MPGLTGLDVARVASGRCHVVFVTAYDQYAVAAFDQGAVDYVMKPFSPARLAMAVARVRERMKGAPANLDGLLKTLAEQSRRPGQFLRWISIGEGKTVRLITIEEICYFQADNKYTMVVTASSQSLINKTIKELLDELDPEVFFQIHREHDRQRQRDRGGPSRPPRPTGNPPEAARGNLAGQRPVRAPVQADVTGLRRRRVAHAMRGSSAV